MDKTSFLDHSHQQRAQLLGPADSAANNLRAARQEESMSLLWGIVLAHLQSWGDHALRTRRTRARRTREELRAAMMARLHGPR